MGEIELLKSLRDRMSFGEFAAHTGIPQSLLFDASTGKRNLGLKSVRKLMDNFPDRRSEIVNVFLRRDAHNSEMINTLESAEATHET